MKIKAKFKGSNSLGYENGKNYNLQFYTKDLDGKSTIVVNMTYLFGENPEIRGGSLCLYTSLKAFLNNWQVLGLLTLTLTSCKKDIIYDTYRDYMLDGISDANVVPPIKLLKNVTGPLLPGKKEKYRTDTWQCIDKRKVDTMYINELNLRYY